MYGGGMVYIYLRHNFNWSTQKKLGFDLLYVQ